MKPVEKPVDASLLKYFAAKYVWWQEPDVAVCQPERVIAQVMELGDYDDVQKLTAAVDEEDLRRVLLHAEAGQFSARSWAYWHYRLGLSEPGKVPPLPPRKTA